MLAFGKITLMLLVFASAAAGQQDHKHEAGLTVAKWYSFRSHVLNEQQSYSIFLPASYANEGSVQTYPVIYVLDGYNTPSLFRAHLKHYET